MNKDEVIALAEKCKLAVLIHSQWTAEIKEFTVVDYVVEGDLASLMQFADLVASAERERLTEAAMKAAEKAVDVAMALEREACVQIVENEAFQHASPVWAFEIVNDIRARGQA